MNDSTERFFRSLEERGQPLLRNAEGKIRFDVSDGRTVERWLVSIDKGDVSVSNRNTSADSVVRAERELFDRLVSGRANAFSEILRGRLVPEGDMGLVVLFQRVFPGPPGAGRDEISGSAR